MTSPFPTPTRKRIESLPFWPEPKRVLQLAMAAAAQADPFAVGGKFPDGSEIAAGYELTRQVGVPDEVYDKAPPPLLYVVVLDHMAGVGHDRGGLTKRTKANDAEKALVELQAYLGREPVAVIASGINPALSSRRYWWKV